MNTITIRLNRNFPNISISEDVSVPNQRINAYTMPGTRQFVILYVVYDSKEHPYISPAGGSIEIF